MTPRRLEKTLSIAAEATPASTFFRLNCDKVVIEFS
jgi:hypothetical protein